MESRNTCDTSMIDKIGKIQHQMYIRNTLSFSKSNRMHEICLRLFLHRYNKEKALAFM